MDPETVFTEAQAAISSQDWDAFFARLHRSDLLRIADNSLRSLLFRHPACLDQIAEGHGMREGAVQALLEHDRAMAESAALLTDGPATGPGAYDSERHRRLVVDYGAAVVAALRSVKDLPRYTAALERRMREVSGGGSVSSRLFVGETLHDVTIDGRKARAIRRRAGWSEEIRFVLKRGTWLIRLLR